MCDVAINSVSHSLADFPHQAAIALGSNLGHSQAILDGALQALRETPHVCLDAYSRYYRTAAVGPPQPDYLNACAVMRTDLSPRALLHTLLDIETLFGRERRERWGPRTLDLDLLLFDNCVVAEPGLTIPHPRMGERAFVLVPLCDVASDWIHPTSQRAIARLIERVDCSGVTPVSALMPQQKESNSITH
ncbi:MAG: 2-amino-4-hydroxy-6-hydroxymethyldihydropteridine diphosphokinase [Cyanobacteria bacterium P01_A01_bin.37]